MGADLTTPATFAKSELCNAFHNTTWTSLEGILIGRGVFTEVPL